MTCVFIWLTSHHLYGIKPASVWLPFDLKLWQDRYADYTFQELDSGYVLSDESIVELIDQDISMDILRLVLQESFKSFESRTSLLVRMCCEQGTLLRPRQVKIGQYRYTETILVGFQASTGIICELTHSYGMTTSLRNMLQYHICGCIRWDTTSNLVDEMRYHEYTSTRHFSDVEVEIAVE